MHINIKSFERFIWLLPFVGFLAGYQWAFRWYKAPSITCPNLLGMSASQALKIVSALNMHLKITTTKPDDSVPHNTILVQSPVAGQKMKPYQTVSCVISEPCTVYTAPACIGNDQKTIMRECEEKKIRMHWYELPYSGKEGICFAQTPVAGQTLLDRKLICYSAQKKNCIVLMPSLIGLFYNQLENLIALYPSITVTTMQHRAHDNTHRCRDCKIIKTRPLPGSLIDISKPLEMNVLLECYGL